MKILITNHMLTEMGGTQAWCLTVADALIERGHKVEAYTLMAGAVSDRMPCTVYTEVPKGPYDLVLCNHNTTLGMLQASRLECPIIFTSHGPLHPLERAVKGATYYVAVSEEVRAVHAASGIFDSFLIRNPIDTDLFRWRSVHDDAVKDVLVMCKNAEASEMAESACHRAGLSCSVAHYQKHPVGYENIGKLMNRHRAVITSGRGIYEALACDVQPFLFDLRSGKVGGDGWVTRDNIAQLSQWNCSGRGCNSEWTESALVDALKAYPYHVGRAAWRMAWVKEHHDVKQVVDRYLEIIGCGTEAAA